MALNRITAADLAGKGNVGLPDTPGLSTEAMQRKLDELALDVIVPKFNGLVDALAAQTGAADIGAEGGTIQEALNALERGKATVNALDALETRVEAAETQKADKSEVLRKGSEEAYTPVGLYDPATKKYVDDTIVAIGVGDMAKSVYDVNGNGVVDNAEALGGVPASGYATAAQMQEATAAAQNAAGAAAAAQTTANQGVSDAAAAQSTANAAVTQAAAAQTTADNAMPKSGGTFTGSVTATNAVRENQDLRNSYVQNAEGTTVASSHFIFRRK